MYNAGGAKTADRVSGHHAVTSNALLTVAKKAAQKRSKMDLAGAVTPDEIAQGINQLEIQGLSALEQSLCASAAGPEATRFCGFIVNTRAVQWVNQQMVNLPIVSQITHQLATLAAGAIAKVADVVQGAVKAVADAAMGAVEQLVDTCKNAAMSIVHSCLNFFGFMEDGVFNLITGKHGTIFLPEARLVV